MLKDDEDFHKILFDGRCKGCEYGRGVSGGGWSFLGCFHEPYKGKWVAEIKDCPIGKESKKDARLDNG